MSKAVAFYEITKGGYTVKQCSFSPINVMFMQSSENIYTFVVPPTYEDGTDRVF